MGKTKHTPTPWRAKLGVVVADVPCGDHATTAIAYCGEEWRHQGGLCSGEEARANAEHIVRAVNLHDELVAAGKKMLALIDNLMKAVPWGQTFDLDVKLLNEAPMEMASAIANATKGESP